MRLSFRGGMSDHRKLMRGACGMSDRQLDLFSARGVAVGLPVSEGTRPAPPDPAGLDDATLLEAIPAAGVSDGPVLATEAGRRRLAAAIPVLEAYCRRFAGFGVDHVMPEQAAALAALSTIGGAEAARAVARLLTRRAVQGPTLKHAVVAAAQLGAELPAEIVPALLRHADVEVRVAACRCVRRGPEAMAILVDLLDDLNEAVQRAASCALGRLGRPEARPPLLRLLREAPAPDVIDAIAPVADEECVVLLGRIARSAPDLADAALAALQTIEHPRAERIIAGFAATRDTAG